MWVDMYVWAKCRHADTCALIFTHVLCPVYVYANIGQHLSPSFWNGNIPKRR